MSAERDVQDITSTILQGGTTINEICENAIDLMDAMPSHPYDSYDWQHGWETLAKVLRHIANHGVYR